MSALPIIEPAPSDAELIARARAGSDDAFTELYERHVAAAQAAARALTRSKSTAEDLVAEGFTRLLSALRNGAGPEVAFRPYLLACVRNAFYDRTRKDSKVDWAPDVEQAVSGDSLALLDPNMDPEERHLIARAFTTLPERWQLVLWHTEVEGRQPADVAPLLGLAPNAVAALAYRAREGLRKAYLQAHLQVQPPEECRFTRERLGAYVRDGVNPREREQIEEHLDHCGDCKAMYLELVDVDSTLRRALIPLVIGVSPAAYLKLIGGGGIVKWVSRSGRRQAAVAAVTVAAVVSGAVLVANATDRDQNNIESVAPSSVGETTTTATTRVDLGTIAPPTRRPSTSFGSLPTSTQLPTVITVNRPPTPGRETSVVPSPGATVVPTVTTPPRNTTTTRRPTTTPTTRPPTATTTGSATSPPSTIGAQPPGRLPSTPPPGGGGGPIVSPAPPGAPTPPGATTPVLRSAGNPTFEVPAEQLYAGDTVFVNVPVINEGATGSPDLNVVLENAAPPPSATGGAGNAPQIPRQTAPGTCTPVGGFRYSCPSIDAGATVTLRIPIVLGARGLQLSLSSDVSESHPLAGFLIQDPVTSAGVFTPSGEGSGGSLALTITNNANNSATFDVNPVAISAPGLSAASGQDAATIAACGEQIVVENERFACSNVSIGPKGSLTLGLNLAGVTGGANFSMTATVGFRLPTVITVPAPKTQPIWSGQGTVDVFTPGSPPAGWPEEVATVGFVGLVWTGDITVSGLSPCQPQSLEGFSFHACDLTPGRGTGSGFNPYALKISGAGDWRLIVVGEGPTRNTSIEVYSRVATTPGDGNTFLLDGVATGAPSLGLVGFRRGGQVELSGSGQSCLFPTPFVDDFTATTPAPANPPCPDLGPDIQFTFTGPDEVIPKLFIVQRSA